MQAGIEILRKDIDQLEAEIQTSQALKDDLVQEIKGKIEQRIKEVVDGASVQRDTDLQ